MEYRYEGEFSKFYDNYLKLLMDDEVVEIDSNQSVKYRRMLKDTIDDLIKVHDIESIIKFMYAASALNNSINRTLIDQVIDKAKVGNFDLRDIINDFNQTLNSEMISIYGLQKDEVDIDEFWKEHISEFYSTIVYKVLFDLRINNN